MTSRREARLWLVAAGLVVLILSTLGLAPDLAGALRDRGAIDEVFVGTFVVLVAAIVLRGLGRRPTLVAVALGVGAATVVAMAVLRSTIPPVERSHLVEYAALALIAHAALEERARHRRLAHHPALLAAVLASGVGVLDEAVQAVLPDRVFDPVDIGFNVGAATFTMVLTHVLRHLRGTTRTGAE